MTGAKVYDVKNLSVEILTGFIFIEVFHSLVAYLRNQRISIVMVLASAEGPPPASQ